MTELERLKAIEQAAMRFCGGWFMPSPVPLADPGEAIKALIRALQAKAEEEPHPAAGLGPASDWGYEADLRLLAQAQLSAARHHGSCPWCATWQTLEGHGNHSTDCLSHRLRTLADTE